MPKYKVTAKIDMWATIEVEADSPEDAIRTINDPNFEEEWDYDTDYDSSRIEEVKELP